MVFALLPSDRRRTVQNALTDRVSEPLRGIAERYIWLVGEKAGVVRDPKHRNHPENSHRRREGRRRSIGTQPEPAKAKPPKAGKCVLDGVETYLVRFPRALRATHHSKSKRQGLVGRNKKTGRTRQKRKRLSDPCGTFCQLAVKPLVIR